MVDLINNYDPHFRMSDDPRKFDQGVRIEQEIIRQLKIMTIEEVKKIPNHEKIMDLCIQYSIKESDSTHPSHL